MVEEVSMVARPESISGKLVREVRRFRNRRVLDFKQVKAGRERAEDLQETVASINKLAALHPAHALYAYAQNQAAVLSEQLTQLPMMSRFVDLIGKAEDTYLPSGPPMSPLTTSYFTCWALFDASVGKGRETVGTCILDLAEDIGLSPDLRRLIAAMQESRMGIYFLRGFEGDRAALEEMVTGVECRAIVPSGYRGRRGERWLVRVLPPPIPGNSPHVVFTTPYVILGPETDEWSAYFWRTLPKLKLSNERQAYEVLMKYGLGAERNYWNEYILEAYVSHRTEAIFLTGLPDVAESRPHTEANP
jgi:hypothetical protein